MGRDGGEDSKALERAIKTLDTSDIPALVRDARAKEIAIKLFTILGYVDLTASRVPNAVTVDAIQIATVGDFGLYLEKVGSNWYFSRVTVGDVAAIFREIEPKLSKRELRELGDTWGLWLTIRSYVPEQLKHTTLFIEDWHWLVAAVALTAITALQLLVMSCLRWLINRVTPLRVSTYPPRNIKTASRALFVVLFTTAVQLFLSTLDFSMDFYVGAVQWLSTIRIIAFAALAFSIIYVLSDRLTRVARGTSSTIDNVLFPLIQKALWIIVVVVAAVQILSVHGVNVSGLIAGLGLGGLAFALAAKDTIENIFGAVAILLDQPFRVGDSINVGGVAGVVEHIGLRSTRLRTAENSLVSMPNSKVISSHVDNLGLRPAWRSRFIFTVSLSTPASLAQALCEQMRATLAQFPATKAESNAVYLNDVSPQGLAILVQFHLFVSDWTDEQRNKEAILLALLKVCNEVGVQLVSTLEPRGVSHLALQSGKAVS
jgi:MscS family membrane protein